MIYELTFQRILGGIFLIVAVFFSSSLRAQNQARIIGDFADPSVISANGKYYAVGTSSEWAPHLPIYTSTDLRDWKQVGLFLKRLLTGLPLPSGRRNTFIRMELTTCITPQSVRPMEFPVLEWQLQSFQIEVLSIKGLL